MNRVWFLKIIARALSLGYLVRDHDWLKGCELSTTEKRQRELAE
jgi:hypothetical protein